MDQEQLEELEKSLNDNYLANISSIKFVHDRANFTKTKDGKIGDILKQRHSQRGKLFFFSLAFVAITTLFVLVLLGLQAYINFHGYKVELVEPRTLQIIVGGLFLQFVGLVGIITRSIWNDKPYLDAGLMKDGKSK